MRSKTISVKKFFIKKMILSAVVQFLVLGFLLIFIKNLVNHQKTNNIANNLLINDSFTLQEISKYRVLGNEYALSMSLYNLQSERKLDSVNFFSSLSKFNNLKGCSNVGEGMLLCKNHGGVFVGISPVRFNGKTIGYVVSKKKYDTIFSKSVAYYLLLILLTVLGVFLFNFVFLFLSSKKRLEVNTKSLLKFIFSDDDKVKKHLDIQEYVELFDQFVKKRDEVLSLKEEQAYHEAIKDVTAQVAHDIKWPISIINQQVGEKLKAKANLEETKIISTAIQRLNDIASNVLGYYKNKFSYNNNLSSSNSNDGAKSQAELVFNLLNQVIAAKRKQFENDGIELDLQSEASARWLFSNVNITDFDRCVSNLINNAIEAKAPTRSLQVKVFLGVAENNNLTIKISDNGIGISDQNKKHVFDKKFTYGKEDGTGLGLFFAKKCIESWGGSIGIESQVNVGTTINIKLPIAKYPIWFCDKLFIEQGITIVIFDDESCVYEVWKEKLQNYLEKGAIAKLLHFDQAKLMKDWIAKNKDANCLCLVDYDLNDKNVNGLDFISSAGLLSKAILVTGMYENDSIRARCIEQGTKIIPKDFISQLITETVTKDFFDCVVVDDDDDILENWKLRAKLVGKRIQVFQDAQLCLDNLFSIEKTTPIYIDVDLGSGIDGIQLSKILYDRGYVNLILCTGHDAGKLEHVAWVKDKITDKSVPF